MTQPCSYCSGALLSVLTRPGPAPQQKPAVVTVPSGGPTVLVFLHAGTSSKRVPSAMNPLRKARVRNFYAEGGHRSFTHGENGTGVWGYLGF